MKELSESTKKAVLRARVNEVTEHLIYTKLADLEKDPNNADILRQIAADELRHAGIWEKYVPGEVKPNMFDVWKFYLIARFFGLTFGIKLMEKGESGAQLSYQKISEEIPEAAKIEQEEKVHENQLIAMIDEDRLKYIGSVMLGLNDALVELTGALAGFSLAFTSTKLIAMIGLITGISASFSMAASEYLATKSEEDGKNPVKAAVYTGIAYVLTVAILISPYFVFSTPIAAMSATMLFAIATIFVFTFYISIAKDLSFWRRFIEMSAISLGVAVLSFGIGYVIRSVFGIDV